MSSSEIEILQQKARFLVATKRIPEEKRARVKNLMDDSAPDARGRYRGVIELLENEPSKEKGASQIQSQTGERPKSIIEPVEGSTYVESILAKYRSTGLIKKRYFARRNNRIGIGCRKRAIPSKKTLTLFQNIAVIQDRVNQHMGDIFNAILEDPEITDPQGFNFLRIFRKWMVTVPFRHGSVESVKWQERHHFEKELVNYIYYYYAFGMVDVTVKENVLDLVEQMVRTLDGFSKVEPRENEEQSIRTAREKENLNREKKVHDYMMAVRSFLSPEGNETPLSLLLKRNLSLPDLDSFLTIMTEALIFQRPFDPRERNIYLEIEELRVSSENWDYSEDLLKKFGKDMESRRERLREELRRELRQNQSLPFFLDYVPMKGSVLNNGVSDQWKIVDNRRYDVKEIYSENYFTYLDGVINYFKNGLLPFIDGTPMTFTFGQGERVSGMIFHPSVMAGMVNRLNDLLTEMHHFKTSNPTLAINRKEVAKIMTGSITTMVHVNHFLTHFGGLFYDIAQPLLQLYDAHKRWIEGGKIPPERNIVMEAVTNDDLESIGETSRPLPYYTGVIDFTVDGTPLQKLFNGRQVMDENAVDGIFVMVTAFCLQAAHDVYYSDIEKDLDRIKSLKKKLKDLSEPSQKE